MSVTYMQTHVYAHNVTHPQLSFGYSARNENFYGEHVRAGMVRGTASAPPFDWVTPRWIYQASIWGRVCAYTCGNAPCAVWFYICRLSPERLSGLWLPVFVCNCSNRTNLPFKKYKVFSLNCWTGWQTSTERCLSISMISSICQNVACPTRTNSWVSIFTVLQYKSRTYPIISGGHNRLHTVAALFFSQSDIHAAELFPVYMVVCFLFAWQVVGLYHHDHSPSHCTLLRRSVDSYFISLPEQQIRISVPPRILFPFFVSFSVMFDFPLNWSWWICLGKYISRKRLQLKTS